MSSYRIVASALAFVSAALAAGPALAQSASPRTPGFEIVAPAGSMGAATGDGPATRGALTAVQLSYGLRPDLVVTGTVGWARMRPVALGDDARLHMVTYDIGAECRRPRRVSDGLVTFKPFTGAGLGARTYHYRHADVDTTNHLAVYVSAGGELGVGRVGLRLEVRDYLTGASLTNPSATTRVNDVAVMAGLRLGLR